MNDNADDILDCLAAKEYLLMTPAHLLPAPGEFGRLHSIFTAGGAIVMYIESSAEHSIWRVCVLRQGMFGDESRKTSRFVEALMSRSGIRPLRGEPVLVRNNKKLEISFCHQVEREGKRITFARSRHGQFINCREEFQISDSAIIC